MVVQEALSFHPPAFRESIASGKAASHARNGIASFLEGKYHAALREFELALQMRPSDSDLLEALAVTLGILGKNEDALVYLDRARLLQPENANVLWNRGVALFSLGRYEEALDSFDRTIEIDEFIHLSYVARGLVLDRLGRFNEALPAFDKALAIRQDPLIKQARHLVLNGILRRLAKRGVISGGRGKPKGSDPPIPVTSGPPVSDLVHQMRR